VGFVAKGFIGRSTATAEVNRFRPFNDRSIRALDLKVSGYLEGATGRYFKPCDLILHIQRIRL
jgi:hypothetical protein